MLTFITGEDVTVAVPLQRDGEPFLADENSVTWSLRDHTGAIALAGQIPLDATDTSITVLIPAAENTILAGRRFEKRFLIVKGTVEAQDFQIQVPYRITPWLNHTVTTDAVRAFIGTFAQGELPDGDIDLMSAYYDIADVVGDDVLEVALGSGGQVETTANDAIKAAAVLRVLPGMQARLSKREEDGVMKVERFPVDLDKIAAEARSIITRAVRLVSGVDDTATPPSLIVLTQPTPELFPGG